MMKNKYLVLTLMVTAALFWVADGEAGWFDKDDRDPDDQRGKSHRYDFMPSMSYHVGTLRRDSYAGWTLDDLAVQFMPDAPIMEGGMDTVLREGRQALVMGPRLGKTIIAWRVRIMESEWENSRDTSLDHLITWSDQDSTVGESEDPGPQ
jgi:hypothetical protein